MNGSARRPRRRGNGQIMSTVAARSGARKVRSSVMAAALVMAIGMLVTACGQSTDRRLVDGYFEEITEQPFYTLPAPVPAGQPGDIVRTEQLQSRAPDGTLAWRILYHSTDVTGADIVVSGTVITPTAAAPAGGRVVVGWAHPTTGAVAKCAPSNGIDPFDLIEGMTDLLNAGLRRRGRRLPGPRRGRTELVPDRHHRGQQRAGRRPGGAADCPRPAPAAAATCCSGGTRRAGRPRCSPAQDAASYAPELQVTAVAVAAPAADLGALLNDHTDDISGVTIGSYAYAAYQAAYSARFPGLTLDSVLTPAGAAATPAMVAAVPVRPARQAARRGRPADRPLHPGRPGQRPSRGPPCWPRTPRGQSRWASRCSWRRAVTDTLVLLSATQAIRGQAVRGRRARRLPDLPGHRSRRGGAARPFPT